MTLTYLHMFLLWIIYHRRKGGMYLQSNQDQKENLLKNSTIHKDIFHFVGSCNNASFHFLPIDHIWA